MERQCHGEAVPPLPLAHTSLIADTPTARPSSTDTKVNPPPPPKKKVLERMIFISYWMGIILGYVIVHYGLTLDIGDGVCSLAMWMPALCFVGIALTFKLLES